MLQDVVDSLSSVDIQQEESLMGHHLNYNGFSAFNEENSPEYEGSCHIGNICSQRRQGYSR